jgi:hypothetical protein
VRLGPVLVASAVLVALAAPASAEEPGEYGDFAGVRNILPPGQSGSIGVAEAAARAGCLPANLADQLEMYDALGDADLTALTEGDLGSYYKDAPLTLADDDAVRVDRPKDGVVVRWDDFGVPYIEGASQQALRASLRAAVDRVLAEQGVRSVSELTYDKHIDDIRFTTAGVVGVRDIDRQNRPPFQQVVAVTDGRP